MSAYAMYWGFLIYFPEGHAVRGWREHSDCNSSPVGWASTGPVTWMLASYCCPHQNYETYRPVHTAPHKIR